MIYWALLSARTLLSPLHAIIDFILITALRGKYCYNFHFIGSGIDTSGTAQCNIIGAWSLSCYQVLGSSGFYSPIRPPLAIHVTYSWPWLCLRPAGHARRSCHLPEVWSTLASSSFWISPCASVYLSASAAHLDWWAALGQEKQGLDSQPGMWRAQLLNKGSASSLVPGLSPQALFWRGTHGLAAGMPSPTAPPAGARVT